MIKINEKITNLVEKKIKGNITLNTLQQELFKMEKHTVLSKESRLLVVDLLEITVFPHRI